MVVKNSAKKSAPEKKAAPAPQPAVKKSRQNRLPQYPSRQKLSLHLPRLRNVRSSNNRDNNALTISSRDNALSRINSRASVRSIIINKARLLVRIVPIRAAISRIDLTISRGSNVRIISSRDNDLLRTNSRDNVLIKTVLTRAVTSRIVPAISRDSVPSRAIGRSSVRRAVFISGRAVSSLASLTQMPVRSKAVPALSRAIRVPNRVI